jgi:ABC-type branched-subunit amino acid transport system substrate-binding protein
MRHLAFLVVTTVVLAGCAPERPEPLEPIKVGVLNPLSGLLQSLGPSWENAARLAAESVNAGGGLFDGRPLELVFRDSATDKAVAVVQAQELIDEGVVGLIGPATSGESAEVVAIATEAEIPMISCCATAADLTSANQPNSGFFFRTTPSDKLQGKALAFVAEEGVEGLVESCDRAAFIYRNDEYGAGFREVFVAEYAGDIINPEVTYGEPGVEADAAELGAKGIELANTLFDDADPNGPNQERCIVVISFDVDGGPVINAVDDELQELISARQAIEPTFTLPYHFLVGDGANSSAFAGIVQDLGPKIIGTVPFHATDNEAYPQFRKAYQQRYEDPAEPIAFTAQNYDAVFIMALAITQSKSVVGKEIRNKLYSVSGQNAGAVRFDGAFFGEIAASILAGDDVDYVGPSGEMTFDAFGDVVGDYVLWQVDPVEGGFAVVERAPLRAAQFDQ